MASRRLQDSGHAEPTSDGGLRYDRILQLQPIDWPRSPIATYFERVEISSRDPL